MIPVKNVSLVWLLHVPAPEQHGVFVSPITGLLRQGESSDP